MRVAAAIAAGMAVLLLGVPVLTLVVRAIVDGSLANVAGDPAVADALRLSVLTTALSLAAILVLGTPLAVVLARHRGRGRTTLETVVDLPLVLPPSVAGLALLLAFGRAGIVGGWLDRIGLGLAFSTAAVVVAQTFVAMPLYVRAARAGIAAVPRELEESARIDGASELEVLRRITLPVVAPTLAGGALVAWARALSEFGATILFAGNIGGVTRTLPLFVYSRFQTSLGASVAAATVLVGVAVALLVVARLVHRPLLADAPTA